MIRVGVCVVAMLAVAPVRAEDTAAGRLAAFVTNRYLADFAEVRADIARLEVLRVCGDQETLLPFLDRVVAAELELRRTLIAEVSGLAAEDLPPEAERRGIATSLLDAFNATDATARAIMLDTIVGDKPDPGTCQATREHVLELLEQPQPTGLKP
jgi:hypothetical protein